MWKLDEAVALINKLASQWEKSGWRFGLTGGVLRAGASKHDLDIIAYPHCSAVVDHDKLDKLLEAEGWSCRLRAEDLHLFWEERGSKDRKTVDIWKTSDLRRVDVFVLQ